MGGRKTTKARAVDVSSKLMRQSSPLSPRRGHDIEEEDYGSPDGTRDGGTDGGGNCGGVVLQQFEFTHL